ncbi:hypothetical protein N7456_004684 [Penicillium angulare]|uniref:Zn(2)-C6 fungal-type domain-containing protein n=1 Tax=Penicillium angulare TaxID=116970 RepID=A0A9W9FX13_9EURO|nr:hypothetical protein N7456_004684 [Penicillium angulare]
MPYDDFYLYPNELHPSFQQPEPLPLRPSELQPTTTPGWHNSFSNVEVPPSMRRPSDASPIEYDFCAGDPLNPKKDYQEKRERSQSELDQQKEEIRQLKEYGGACDRCYKSKKKCGPSSPCPPCRANKRKCVRRGSSISGHKDTHSSDADISSSPSVEPPVETQVIEETLDTMQPGPWEPQLIPSIDGTYCDDDAGCSQESKG